jgi:MFS family permease
VWTIAGMIMAGLATAPLGAFRAEIFPTALRAKAGSIMDTVSLAGSAVGLVLVGWLIDRWDVFGRPMALVAIGPLIVVALVLAVFPETAGRTLEDLNPADRAPPPPEPPPPVIAADTGFRL